MKSILVIETPKNCLDCQLMVDGWCYAVKADRTQDAISAKDRTCWCPLRPLPNRKEDLHYPCNEYLQAINEGWNACIDEILGETE